jgi:hypothetical protein
MKLAATAMALALLASPAAAAEVRTVGLPAECAA